MQNFTMKALYIYILIFFMYKQSTISLKSGRLKRSLKQNQPKTHSSWKIKDPSPHTTLTHMTHSSSKLIKTKPRNDKASHTDA